MAIFTADMTRIMPFLGMVGMGVMLLASIGLVFSGLQNNRAIRVLMMGAVLVIFSALWEDPELYVHARTKIALALLALVVATIRMFTKKIQR